MVSSRASIRSTLPRIVLISPLWAMRRLGVGPLPGRVGVGGEAGVDQGHGGLIVAALQIRIEAPQLFHQKHALIDDGTAGQ